MSKIAPLNTLIFFGKMFYYFFIAFIKNVFFYYFLTFYKKKTQMLSKKVFVSCKIFKYWIEKNVLLHVSLTKLFSGAEFDSKTYNKPKFSPKKKCVKLFFHIKFLCIGFWEHILIYQHSLMFPIFFFILNCLFAMSRNPVIGAIHAAMKLSAFKLGQRL